MICTLQTTEKASYLVRVQGSPGKVLKNPYEEETVVQVWWKVEASRPGSSRSQWSGPDGTGAGHGEAEMSSDPMCVVKLEPIRWADGWAVESNRKKRAGNKSCGCFYFKGDGNLLWEK